MSEYHADPATHAPLRAAGAWYACEHPERPADGRTAWGGRCRACRLHAAATLRNDPSQAGKMVDRLNVAGKRIAIRTLGAVALDCAREHDDPILAREAHAAIERFNRDGGVA